MALSDITEQAVIEAVGECDRLGRDAFLEEYKFRSARAYWLVYNGRRYDSKAIAGVAHKYTRPKLGVLRNSVAEPELSNLLLRNWDFLSGLVVGKLTK